MDKKGVAAYRGKMLATDGGFQFKAGEPAGEMAMIRGLDTTAGLDSGTFSVTMWGVMGGADEPAGGGAGGAAGAEGGTAWAKRIGRKGTWHLSFRGEVVR